MGTPRAVKQRMYYSLKGKPQPIYETDKDGNIVYLIIGGEQVPKETGETTSGYSRPIEFFNSIGGQLSQADVEAFGVQDTTVATMTYKPNQYPFQVGTLIWKNTPIEYKPNGDIDTDTADYKVIGVETTGKKYWRAIIKANVRDERINCSITKKGSIKRAIQELEAYKKSLNYKTELFVTRLADIGVNIAMMTLATEGQGDSPRGADFAIKIDNDGNMVKGMLTVSSESILFWEFGSGIRFNSGTKHPKADEFGMGPGTYPGQTHVPDPGYWYYYPKGSDNAVRSEGTQAIMPMYKASMEMISKIHQIAKEVFS